ncbi:MAG TPA: BTAD domain-containing putative transcriptional regulator [Anaerolineae bacterium]|nr:BTAD domain-containing putative transcriptional regulator [Anaerolineae bacterium]
MPTLHVHLLGDFRLVYDGKPVTTVVQARLQALLAYLLLHRDSPQPRQRLAFLFWPDTAEPQAHTNLRQLLHHLRHSLPAADQFLQIDTKTVQWRLDAPFALDVAEFEHDLTEASAAAKAGRPASERTALESAVQHYGGDLLPGCYDDWILPERECLRQAYFGALERLIHLTEDQRDYRSAIGHAERLLRHDPLHETTCRRLIRLHALNGERARALRVYHTCVTVLERELGVEPNADTQEAYRRLVNMEAPAVLRARPPAMSGARPALVGRHGEWMMLRSAWRRAAAGHAAFVLISGEAGIGKTRLAEEFLEWAGQQGMTTARTRSYAAEGQLAYAPVAELLRADPLRTRLSRLEDVWLTELARLLPELLVEHPDLPNPQPITDGWQRKRLFEALARAALGDKGPLLLLLDDLQWCDQDTLEWLHYLLHFDAEAMLLIIGAVRFEEVDQAHPLTPLVLDSRNREQLTEIDLGPLDAGDTTALAEQMAGRKLDAGQASRLYRYTEGNPLFVVETIRAEVSGGEAYRALVLPNPPPSPRPPFSTEMPAKVQALIQARLSQLSPSARELAGLAATISRAFTSDVLARASESDEGTLLRALDELWRRRIVREQGSNAYDFSHDRIREVTYAEVSAARRQVLHRRVAAALEQIYSANLDAVSGQIAVHYEQAGRAAQAIAYYQHAARVAQQTFSNAEVISLLTRALALLSMLPDTLERTQTELTMLITLGTALMSSKGFGHPEVEQTLLRAWALCRTLGEHEQTIPVLAGLWLCYHMRADLAQRTVWAEHLEREVRTTSNAQFHAMAHFALTATALFRGDFLAARQYAEQGLAGFDPGQLGSQSILFGYEFGSAIVPFQALSLWMLGYPDQARKHMHSPEESFFFAHRRV